MRPTTAGLKAAMSSTPRTLGWLGKFRFASGTTIRVSSTGANVTFDDGSGSATWTKDKSFKVSTLKDRGTGDVPDGDITAPAAISSAYSAEDVFIGIFKNMTITLYALDYTDPSDGSMQRGPYTVSEIVYDDRGKIAAFEIRGILQRAKEITVEEYSVGCRSTLGDQRSGQCRVPLYPNTIARNTAYALGAYVRVSDAGNFHNRMFRCTVAGTTAGSQPSYDFTVGNSTTDGTAHFIAEEAWVRSGTVATRASDSSFTVTLTEGRAVDGWFNLGAIKWVTGNNAGTYSSVRSWVQSTTRILIWGQTGRAIQVGDTFEIIPGCDKRFTETCLAKFNNTINYRGENLLPGRDFLSGAGL